MIRLFLILSALATLPVAADGLAIDKVYHPYIQPLETEIEARMISADGEQKYRFGLGKSFSDNLYFEAYLIAEDDNHGSFHISEYELEAKYQLSEQGEYDYDWGVVAEIEKSRHDDNWEVATGLIIERQWGKYIGTANLWLIYEWGQTVKSELESAMALQARYRLSRVFEPAIEIYTGEDTRAIGPVAMGDVRFSGRKKLHWETGVIFGVDHKTPDTTLRLLTEYEF